MSSFVRSIHLFQSGQLSHDELLEEINRHLAIERASPTALLEILASQQLIQPLHSDVHKSILNCLRNWPQDPTVVTRTHASNVGGTVAETPH